MNVDVKNEMIEAQNRLAQLFEDCIQQFFADGKNADISPLDFIMKPMLLAVMKHHKGNQSKAAIHLKLARGTLRKELQKHFARTDVGLKFRESIEELAVKNEAKELC